MAQETVEQDHTDPAAAREAAARVARRDAAVRGAVTGGCSARTRRWWRCWT